MAVKGEERAALSERERLGKDGGFRPAHVVGIDGAEGKVLCRDAHFGERVEEGAFAYVGEAHNSNLQEGRSHVPMMGRQAMTSSRHIAFSKINLPSSCF